MDIVKYEKDLFKLLDLLKEVKSHTEQMHAITVEEAKKIEEENPDLYNKLADAADEIETLCGLIF